ncbi:MAG TPA: TIGR03013 family XrtA/PEP-CTERM system glycosyltransferase [Steroidobacteraceae bacterium]|nr:TIGR03013 family XrtA/PEP-CTERM system glycosyltransferase [Steroidobacteraceae bacterium]
MTIRIFQHYWQLPLALLAILEGTIFLAAMHYTAPFTLSGPVPPSQHPAPWVPHSLLFAGIMFVSMAAMGLYNSRQRARLAGLLSRVAASMLGGAMVIAVIVYLLPVLRIGRGALLLSTLVSFGAVAVVRIAFDLIVDEAVFKRRVLVYGAGRRAASIVRLRRRSDRRGFLIVGYVMADGDDLSALRDHERLVRSDQDLLSYCQAQRIDEIVVAMDDRRRRFPMDQLLECRLEGFEISELVTFLERETGKVRLDILNPSWMIFAEGFRQGRAHGIFERLFDVVASFVMLAATAPVMLLTAAAIKISDGWRAPIFYRQIRVGQYGKPFKLLKFRSMREDAEREGKAQWAQKNDSRITRVGSFIRTTRIDELPQILNVLRGEMSFVGPRPERPEFVEQLNETIPYYRERHSIKPGITGWAQLCYPYGSSEQDAIEKLQYDLYYVKNHSLIFYIAILVQTVEVIVWGKGAR